ENSPSFNQILEKTTYSPLLAINLNRRRVYESQAVIAMRRGTRMSTATIKTPESEPSYPHLVKRTIEACRVAKEAAAAAAEGIATGSSPLLNSLRDREKELDNLDMEIDAGVTTAITRVTEGEARELLACMKVMIGLERIGDLLLS